MSLPRVRWRLDFTVPEAMWHRAAMSEMESQYQYRRRKTHRSFWGRVRKNLSSRRLSSAASNRSSGLPVMQSDSSWVSASTWPPPRLAARAAL